MQIDATSKSRVAQHISSKRHDERSKTQPDDTSKQTSITNFVVDPKKQEILDLLTMLIGLDIPLSKLDSDLWKKWSAKYLNFNIPSRRTLMKAHLPVLHEQV
jgi:hypothetical protein